MAPNVCLVVQQQPGYIKMGRTIYDLKAILPADADPLTQPVPRHHGRHRDLGLTT